MRETLASSRYARALFGLAKKENSVSTIETQLETLVKIVSKHPEVIAIFQNPTIKVSEKISFVEKIIPANSPALLKNFLKTLLEKKRLAILSEIRAEFHKLFEKDKGILEVEVLSAIPFSKTLQEKIKKVLTTKLHSEIRLIPKIDISLIGGFLLRFNDREIDCSLKNRFYEIEQQLITS